MSQTVAIDPQAVLWSAPERQRAGRPLLVLLHGYGSHEGDLFGLSPQLPLTPVIASLRAPVRERGGFAWYSLEETGIGRPSAAKVNAAAAAVIDWLDTLQYSSVSLLGFSQGASICLQLVRHAPRRFAATVAIAGFIPTLEHAGDDELTTVRPPVFWGRGTLDQVIPSEAIARTSVWLPAHTTPTIRIYEDLAHAISPQELGDMNHFLRAHA